MSARTIFRSIRWLSVVFLAMTASGWLAPVEISAGCSHPLWPHTDQEVKGLDLINFADFHGSSPIGLPASDESSPGPGPCRGAFCSGHPATPIVPFAVPIQGTGNEVATLALSPSLSEPQGSYLTVSDDPEHPTSEGSSLFRPPRRGS